MNYRCCVSLCFKILKRTVFYETIEYFSWFFFCKEDRPDQWPLRFWEIIPRKLVIKFELVAGAAGDEQRQCPRRSSGQQKLLMQLMNCCLLIGKPESEQILLCSFCRTWLLNYELRKLFCFCIAPACKYVFIFICCCWRVPLFVVIAVVLLVLLMLEQQETYDCANCCREMPIAEVIRKFGGRGKRFSPLQRSPCLLLISR